MESLIELIRDRLKYEEDRFTYLEERIMARTINGLSTESLRVEREYHRGAMHTLMQLKEHVELNHDEAP